MCYFLYASFKKITQNYSIFKTHNIKFAKNGFVFKKWIILKTKYLALPGLPILFMCCGILPVLYSNFFYPSLSSPFPPIILSHQLNCKGQATCWIATKL